MRRVAACAGPWRTGRFVAIEQETQLLESRKFRVVRLRETLADGLPHELDVIRHAGAAVILPILDDGRVVMIANRRAAIGQELLELPAGTLEAGEEPARCAARELAEETGYVASDVRPIVSFYSTPGICDERMHAFLATGLSKGAARPERGEELRIELLPFEEVLDLVRSGRVCDAKTIATVLYYERFCRMNAK